MRTRTRLAVRLLIVATAAAVAAPLALMAPAQASASYQSLELAARTVPAPPEPTGPLPGAPRDIQPNQQQLALLTSEERNAVAVVEYRHTTTGYAPSELAQLQEQGLIIAPNGCSTYNDNLYAWNGTDDIWRWSLPVNWCWNGSRVTSIQPLIPSWKVYSWASVLGWSYESTVDKAQWDYYGDRWVYRNYAQGHFSYCPIRIGCLQHMYPYEYVDAYGNGGAGTAAWGGASHT